MATTELRLPSSHPLSPVFMQQRVLSPLTMSERIVTLVRVYSLPTSVIDFILASLAGDRLTTLTGEELVYV